METKFESILDYINYFISTIINKPLIFIISTLMASILTIITTLFTKLSNVLVINIVFGYIFIALALLDVFTGIIASRIEKKDFSSPKFFKKPSLVMFFIFIIWILQSMIKGLNDYPHVENSIFESLLTSGIFLIESLKLGLIIFYIIYELTSLRENFLRLKLKEFVRIVDFILIPLQKFSDYITKRFDKIIDDDLNTSSNNININNNENQQ